MNYPTEQAPVYTPPKPKTHRVLKTLGALVAVGGLLGIGSAIGSAGNGHTVVRTVAGPTVVQHDPGPVKTVTVPAPPPPAGTVINTFHGTGNQVTPAFNVPASGDYVVKWSFSGNVDPQLGQPSNFIIGNTGDGIGDGLANTIAASGSGSTEVTMATGTDTLNVQADGSWAITVISAQ